jgi:manganese oxidase
MKLRLILVFLLLSMVAGAAAAATIGPPRVLPQTSANGPAIVFRSPSRLLIAWTGTGDGNLLLNFQRRLGTAWQPKVTTGHTSPAAPALAFFNGRYYVAWIGAHGYQQLNLMSSADGVKWGDKVTLDETSQSSPALAAFAGRLYLGWRGVGNNRLNLINSTNGTKWGGKVTLGETSTSGPALAATPSQLLIAWRGVGDNRINVIRGNGSEFSDKVTLPDTTTARPALAVRGTEVILAWQGVTNNRLNTMVSTNGGASFTGKFTSGQTSIDGPALAATGVIAWTGTNPGHNLNVAALGGRTLVANVVALNQPFFHNRLGANLPGGLMFALERDVCAKGGAMVNGQPTCGSVDPTSYQAGNVMLRPYRRPRPLVLRMNRGDCLQVNFRNLLNPTSAVPPSVSAGFHAQGLEWVNGPQDDGSSVGKNPSSLVAPQPQGQSGPQAAYTLYAPHEGTFLLYSTADTISGGGGGDGGQLQQGLFGAVHVQPSGGEYYRSQVTSEDLKAATSKPSPYGQPEISYQALYPNTSSSACYTQGFCRIGPVLNMVCTDEAVSKGLCQSNEIVHSDLTAIISGPGAGRFIATDQEPPILQSSYALPDRLEPYREFTIVYHETFLSQQAFPQLYANAALKKPLVPGGDFFAFNYGTGGIGSEILANRLNAGPMGNCPTCKYEEFFLSAWVLGDPAMVVDVPATAYTANGAGQCTWSGTAYTCTGPKATRAFYPDDPSNVYHSYLADHTKFRILHGGSDLHHVHHQHAHQWLHSPDTANGDYTDSQSIGPGSAFTLEMVYNGGGNVNQTVGDSIFHCHFYPHFAAGMWSMWRVHDVYETGTELDTDGLPKTGVVRALPDGEITRGTPIPALVPLPTIPMPPMPAYVRLANGATTVEVCDKTSTGTACNNAVSVLSPSGSSPSAYGNPGYPFFIPGIAGQRAAHPPMDFAYACADNGESCTPSFLGKPADTSACASPQSACLPLDGGLPRHLVRGCAGAASTCAAIPALNPTDFSKTLEKVDAFQLPEDGTFIEQVAMAAMGENRRFVPSVTPEGNDKTVNSYDPTQMRDASFVLNGLAPVPGAPYADPCIDYSLEGGPVEPFHVRRYKAAVIQSDVAFNKEGWHYPQQRLLTLWGDVQDTLQGKRPPEPFFFRANSGECIEYTHANLVPNVYELDDFQVRTPTDILGQHIHLVKFDVTSSDGASNGFNYEDGTFAPNEVVERIAAINAQGGLAASAFSTSRQPLTAKTMPFFGAGPGGEWMGAQATIQRWLADVLRDGTYQEPGIDRTLRTVFTHDHYGPSTHQQAGLYAGLIIEPESSNWYWNDKPDAAPFGGVQPDGTPLPGRVATGPTGLKVQDGGPTTWQAVIVPQDDPDSAFREFLLEMQDTVLTYAAFDTLAAAVPAPAGFCSDTGKPCTPVTFTQPATGCNYGAVCYANGFCSSNVTQRCAPDPVFNYVCGHCTNGTCSNNSQLTCGTATNAELKVCPTSSTSQPSCNLIPGIPGTALTNTTTGQPFAWGTTPINAPGGGTVELITLGGASNNFLMNYRNEPILQRVNSASTAANTGDLSWVYTSLDRGSLRGQCSTSKAACTKTSQCPSGQTCTLGGFTPQTNVFCTPVGSGCGAFPYPTTPLTPDVQPGDPFTPLLRAYAGDDVQVRTLTGAHINPHNFTIQGTKWLMEPSFVDSGWRNSQLMAISEHFEQVFKLDPLFKGGAPKTDYLYMGGAAAIEQMGGNWGLMRAYGTEQTGAQFLRALPQNPPQNLRQLDPCPGPPTRSYDVVATTAGQALPGGALVYNSRSAQGAQPIIQDPKALVYINLRDLVASDGTSACTSNFASCKLPSGARPRPLVLRAAAGDCIKVTLYNAINAANVGPGATSPMPLTGSSAAPVSLSSTTSTTVGLHPQLVTFDGTKSNGFNAGGNPQQTVAAGSGSCPANANAKVNCATYTWYAGNVDPKAADPFIPVELGASNLLPTDPINHYQYGLFGALVVEPLGATCGTDGKPLEECRGTSAVIRAPERTFREHVAVFQDGLTTLWSNTATPQSASQPTLGGGNLDAINYSTEVLSFSEPSFTTARACNGTSNKDVSCFLSAASTTTCCTAINISGGANKPTCSSFGACGALQTPTFQACTGEEVRFRVLHPGGINTVQVFELFGQTFSEAPYVSSGLGCLTPTTHTNLYSASEIGILNGCAAASQKAATMALDAGTLAQLQRNFSTMGQSDESLNEWIGSHMGHGPQNHLEVFVESAGGVSRRPGDYLFRSYPAMHFRLGPWGIFQVLSPQDAGASGLQCIGGQ